MLELEKCYRRHLAMFLISGKIKISDTLKMDWLKE